MYECSCVFPQVCGLAPASAGSSVTRTDAGARLWALIADISRPSQGRGRPHRPRFRGAVTTLRPAEAWPCTVLQKISRVSTITFTSALHSHSGDQTSHTLPKPSPQRAPAGLHKPDTGLYSNHVAVHIIFDCIDVLYIQIIFLTILPVFFFRSMFGMNIMWLCLFASHVFVTL